ncbi:MAG: tRNA (adenosine(37)-N6)-threonylcarbamoyltransferase complex dimerization subunit type 1 TsaB [Flavobacteriaceae bacterium]|nr:tRNA (adenosine(37)-N6)-threonylcarbamoyltransferase complex dimerization subunit type 1 TsaB [Flavobacteriaceae bacterium]MBT4113096.1 tRNA (adenosine(37)-N6)-threonylcarbamoyltransferase complex dimerization subunit type 1 TsaB [Flavobacteriaceae bacterium]MBT4613913.1 tRNA (adenosine(37)-N6)-threonylcarbamoyltransferase complex dimerization subunit type 1 TsaB [Flavobacteriaceae bacterium]MBT5246125.1 tRNA (adenosine(37)-N6)-threonylcarbamoyltransferase complex dimerization subunit type 1 
MAYILNIETSTTNCSVSLFNDLELIDCLEENTQDYSHSKSLHVFIDSVLKNSKLKPKDLSAISVSKGPGSYTGLRIGVASAKGLCFALDIPLISIETLKILSENTSNKGIAIPCLDARRMEVYSAVFNNKNERIRDTRAEILNEDSFNKYLSVDEVYFIGNANKKIKEIIAHKNARFIDDVLPSSRQMGALSFNKFKNNQFEDLNNFEPLYLKDFIGTKWSATQ